MLLIAIGIVGFAILVRVGWWAYNQIPDQYDSFARCLKDKDVAFYGAYWCPACQSQKALFGRSQRLLPYKECARFIGSGMRQSCVDAGIERFPTWEFADKSRQEGVLTFDDLTAKTGCVVE